MTKLKFGLIAFVQKEGTTITRARNNFSGSWGLLFLGIKSVSSVGSDHLQFSIVVTSSVLSLTGA